MVVKSVQDKEFEKLKPELVEILKQHKIKKAGVFGSYARGQQKKNSDIDILVDFDKGLIELVSLEMLLKKKLGKKVDLITYRSINKLLKNKILKEEIRVI